MSQIKYNNDAKELIKQGIDSLVDAVKVTLGPNGKNVIIYQDGVPHITKDGVTVAKSIFLDDPYLNLGAELVKQAASKTVSEVGDGTTTCSILTQAITDKGYYMLDSYNPTELKKGMDKAVKHIVEYWNINSTPITNSTDANIKHIATISSNNDSTVGSIIANIYSKITLDGTIIVEASDLNSTEIEISNGMKIGKGFASPVFINNHSKATVEFDNPVIFIHKGKINYNTEVREYLEYGIKNQVPIVIIADDFDNSVLSHLSLNNSKGLIKICPVKSPGFGDRKDNLLEDIFTFTNDGTICSAKKVISTVDSTVIIGGTGSIDKIEERVNILKETLEHTKNSFDKEDINKRISNLCGGVATIYVGAKTEVEMLELKDRIDDSVCAVKSAIKGGISVGGGLSFINAYKHFAIDISVLSEDERAGVLIILESLLYPIWYNLLHSGYEKELTNGVIPWYEFNQSQTQESASINWGFNTKTFTWEDLMKSGVVDSTKSLISALENATSVASMFLTTECAIVN